MEGRRSWLHAIDYEATINGLLDLIARECPNDDTNDPLASSFNASLRVTSRALCYMRFEVNMRLTMHNFCSR